MVLSNYLQKHGIEVKDIINQVDYSQTQLENLAVISYPNSVLEVIGKVVKKDLSMVLFELLMLENPEKISETASYEDLAIDIKKQQAYIYIPASIRTENNRLVNSVLSEKDTLGLELGSRGTVYILGEVIYQIQKIFNPESKEFKELKSKLRHYLVKIHDENGSILYEKEEAY